MSEDNNSKQNQKFQKNNFSSKVTSVGKVLQLNYDSRSKASNIVQVSKQLDIFTRTTYKTLGNCMLTRVLEELSPPRPPNINPHAATESSQHFLDQLLPLINPDILRNATSASSVPASLRPTTRSQLSTTSTAILTNDLSMPQSTSLSSSSTSSSSAAAAAAASSASSSMPTSTVGQQAIQQNQNAGAPLLANPIPIRQIQYDDRSYFIDPNLPDTIKLQIYMAHCTAHSNRMFLRKDELSQLYGVLMDVMSTSSKIVVTAHHEFEEAEEECDGFKLWKIIYQTHRSDIDSDYVEFRQDDVKQRFNNARQRSHQSIAEYFEYFKDTVRNYEEVKLPRPEDKEQVVRFLKSLDPNQYSDLHRDLNNFRDALLKDVKNLQEAYQLAARYQSRTGYRSSEQTSRNVYQTVINRDNSDHHNEKVSDHDESRIMTKFCKIHKHGNHSSEECRTLNRKKNWQSNNGNNSNNNNNNNHSNNECGYAEYEIASDSISNIFTVSNMTSGNQSNEIVLDSGAQLCVFNNPKLLTNITDTSPIYIRGINKNAKSSKCNQVGTLIGFDKLKIYLSCEVKKNIISFGELQKHYQIEFNQSNNTYSALNDSTTTIKFNCLNNLYIHNYNTSQSVNVVTLADKLKLFSKKEIERANLVRDISKRLGYESYYGLKNVIRNGSIANLPITVEDVNTYLKIYEREESHIKGKTVKIHNKLPLHITVERSQEKIQRLYIDLMYVFGKPFLVSVSEPLDLIMIDPLKNKSSKEVSKSIVAQLSKYKSESFYVNEIICDNDQSIISEEAKYNLHGAKMIKSGVDAHLTSIVDRKIRSIKDRLRTLIEDLPFNLPPSIALWAVMFVVSRLNLLKHSHSLDNTSPRELFIGRKTNYQVDLPCGFGEYCQVTVPDLDNSMKERTTSCISLMPTGNKNGSVQFYNLLTKKIIVRDQFIILPLPDNVIHQLNEQYALENGSVDEELMSSKEVDENSPSVETPPEKDYQLVRNLPPVEELNDEDDDSEYSPPMGFGRVVTKTQEFIDLPDSDCENEIVPTPQTEMNNNTSSSHDTSCEFPVEPLHDDDDVMSPLQMMNEEPIFHEQSTHESAMPPSTAHEPISALRSSRRNITAPSRYQLYNLTIDEALEEDEEKVSVAIGNELSQMIDKEVWHPIKLNPLNRVKILNSKLFLKKKLDQDGNLIKWKARLVANGAQQIRESSSETSSPTLHCTSAYLLALTAAVEGHQVCTLDIVGAYLNAKMEKDIYIRINKKLSAILININPTYNNYCDSYGNIIVKLDRALYGCIESAKLWYDDISGFLMNELGFTKSEHDDCIFTKIIQNNRINIGIFVDDFIITCKEINELKKIEEKLKVRYKDLSANYGLIHSYLGMMFDFTEPLKVKINMEKYIREILTEFNITTTCNSPANNNLFSSTSLSMLQPERSRLIHSGIAKLLYLSTHTRPDISLAVNYLCGRVTKLTMEDEEKFQRILKYLNKTIEHTLTLESNGLNVVIDAFVDASYGIHSDRKSQSGIAIIIGRGAIISKSVKQRIVTKSSTESELIACTDALSFIYTVKNLAEDLGFNVEGINLHQDNQSTIKLIMNNKPTSQRTKHIDIRYFFLRDHQHLKNIKVVYTNTKEMIADLLTKPLQGELLHYLTSKLLNIGA